MSENLFFHTADGKVEAAPTGGHRGQDVRIGPVFDPGIDTAGEARLWQERLDRLEREANDATSSPQARHIAKTQLDAMKKATPGQLAAWRDIDARRGSC